MDQPADNADEGRGTADRPPSDDPVLVKRAKIARLVKSGQRIGYSLFGLAMVVFIIGFATGGLKPWMVSVIIGSLVIGSIVLAPAIVFGYAVGAADRADRDDDW